MKSFFKTMSLPSNLDTRSKLITFLDFGLNRMLGGNNQFQTRERDQVEEYSIKGTTLRAKQLEMEAPTENKGIGLAFWDQDSLMGSVIFLGNSG